MVDTLRVLRLLTILIIISLVFSIFSYFGTTSIDTTISSEVLTGLEPKFDKINNQLESINNSLWLESEEHYIEIMDKMVKSIVQVISYPSSETSGENAVFFIDENGRKWSLGTGFSIDDDGRILTAYHIVKNSENVVLILQDGETVPVSKILNFPELDLSILDIKTDVPQVEFEEKQSKVGTTVGFIGFPLGNEYRITTQGTISGAIKFKYNNDDVVVYTINSFSNKGNSGGPVFSLKNGRVIGIVNAKLVEKEGFTISTVLNSEIISLIKKEANISWILLFVDFFKNDTIKHSKKV